MIYVLSSLTAFVLTGIFIPLAFALSKKYRAVAKPNLRTVHKKDVFRLGGVAIIISFFLTSFLFGDIGVLKILLLPSLLIFVAGFLDDTKGIKPAHKLFFQILAAVVVVLSGVSIGVISNPFGGVLDLKNISFGFMHLGQILSVLWIVLIINIVNLSDGLDGLAAGVSGIASVVLAALSLKVGQPQLAVLFAVMAGSTFGFLPKNFHPAKIFMGDTGAMLIGLILAVLSIASGAKIAALALVIGFPFLDTFWSVIRRFARGGLGAIFQADKFHLHHLLLDAGLSHRGVVLFFYIFSMILGTLALFGQTKEKLITFFGLILAMIAILGLVFFQIKRQQKKQIT